MPDIDASSQRNKFDDFDWRDAGAVRDAVSLCNHQQHSTFQLRPPITDNRTPPARLAGVSSVMRDPLVNEKRFSANQLHDRNCAPRTKIRGLPLAVAPA